MGGVERRGVEGVENKTPKALRGWRMGRVSPTQPI